MTDRLTICTTNGIIAVGDAATIQWGTMVIPATVDAIGTAVVVVRMNVSHAAVSFGWHEVTSR